MNKELDLARLILNLSNTIIYNRNKHLEVLGLTSSQADAMKFFLANENTTTRALKDAMGVTHQTAQGIVSRLVEKGFITVEKSQTDKRCQIVHITEMGLSLSDKINANGERTAAILISGMSEAEENEFIHLLRIAYQNAKNDGKLGDINYKIN